MFYITAHESFHVYRNESGAYLLFKICGRGAEKLALALQNHAHLRVTKNILLKSQNQFKGIAEALDHLRLNCTPLVVTDMTNLLY